MYIPSLERLETRDCPTALPPLTIRPDPDKQASFVFTDEAKLNIHVELHIVVTNTSDKDETGLYVDLALGSWNNFEWVKNIGIVGGVKAGATLKWSPEYDIALSPAMSQLAQKEQRIPMFFGIRYETLAQGHIDKFFPMIPLKSTLPVEDPINMDIFYSALAVQESSIQEV